MKSISNKKKCYDDVIDGDCLQVMVKDWKISEEFLTVI